MSMWETLRQHKEAEAWDNPVPENMEVVKVVGMTFVPEYPKNLLSLHNLFVDPARGGDIIVQLVRNPGNKYDKNAIEVRLDNRMLGHLPKDVAARLAPGIDDGSVKILATVYQVRVHPDNPQNPGFDVLLDYGV